MLLQGKKMYEHFKFPFPVIFRSSQRQWKAQVDAPVPTYQWRNQKVLGGKEDIW